MNAGIEFAVVIPLPGSRFQVPNLFDHLSYCKVIFKGTLAPFSVITCKKYIPLP